MSETDFTHPRYQLIKPLGKGGMGTVYEALDLDSNSPVALKLLEENSPADRRLFESEIQTLGSLQHESIVGLVDAGVIDNRLYFTMEYLQGRPLAGLLEEPIPSSRGIDWILSMTIQILSALEYIHEQGIIHGDLKPSNIMVLSPKDSKATGSGNHGTFDPEKPPTIKLMDFGLARGSSRLTRNSLAAISAGLRTGGSAGTPLYMSPEQLAANAVTERSDLYSLGALLYHLITLRLPFENMASVLTRKPPPAAIDKLNPACSGKLSEAVFALMDEAPHKRPASAEEAAGLFAALSSSPPETPPSKPRLMRPVFVGRERERALILENLDNVCETGSLQSIRVVGEGGIGKSWLFHSSGLKTRAEVEKGARVLSSSFRRGTHRQGGLGRILLEDPAAEYSDGFRRRFCPPGQLDNEKPEALESRSSQEGSNDTVIAEAAGILRSLALQHPLVVILEDLQYASDADVDLLERLMAALKDLPILVLLSYREEAGLSDSPVERISRQLDRIGHPAPLRLGQLEDHAVGEYVEAVLSPRLPAGAELMNALRGSSRGNPLALHRLLGQLVATESLVREDNCWDLAEKPDPSTTGEDTGRLIESLSPTARLVLTVSGLLDETFDGALLACVLEDHREAVSIPTTIAFLVSSGLLLEGPEGYRLEPGFPLRILLETSNPRRVRKLHKRIASLLLELNPSPDSGLRMKIAGHLDQAGDETTAFAHYLDAARLGANDYSNQLSMDAYSRTLELAPQQQKPGILRELALLQVRCGRINEALDHLFEAEELETAGETTNGEKSPRCPQRLFDLWDDIGRVLHRQGRLEEAEEYFRRCMDLAEADTSLMARTCYGLAGVFFDRHDFVGARDHYQRSLEYYGSSAEAGDLVPLHLGLALIERIENNLGRSIDRFKKALALAQQTGNLLDIARIQANLANTHRAMGEMDVALVYLDESTRTRKLVGDRQGLAVCLNNLARIQNHRGEFQAALETTGDALSTFQDVGDRKGIAIARCNLGELLLLLGRPLDARRMLEECDLLDRENEGSPLACNILCNLARVELTLCEFQKAEGLFDDCLRKLPTEPDQELRIHALAGLAEIFLYREMTEAAEDAIREAEDLSANSGGKETAQGLLRGIRMRLSRQRGSLEETIELGRDSTGNGTDRYAAARISLELGAAYRDLGPDWADKTEKYLKRAAEEFENMGCPVEAAETLGELSIYWHLTGEEGTAAEYLQHAENLLGSEQLSSRLCRFTEVFKERLQ